jgi:hypothetical protein
VKKSCCDEACEEIIVPCGHFAFEAEGIYAGSPSDQIVHVLEGGEVGWRVLGADAAFVVAKIMSITQCRLLSISQWLRITGPIWCANHTREVM